MEEIDEEVVGVDCECKKGVVHDNDKEKEDATKQVTTRRNGLNY